MTKSSTTKHQLFRKIPSKDVVLNILKAYNIDGFDTCHAFTLADLENHNTIKNLETFTQDLENCYLKCKWKYFTNLTPKKSITLLRQILRLYGYKLKSREKCVNGVKFNIYKIIEAELDIVISEKLTKELKVSFN